MLRASVVAPVCSFLAAKSPSMERMTAPAGDRLPPTRTTDHYINCVHDPRRSTGTMQPRVKEGKRELPRKWAFVHSQEKPIQP